MPFIGAIIALALVGALGNLQAGKAARSASRRNAEELERRAGFELESTDISVSQSERDSESTLSQIEADIGASNLLMSGSPLLVLNESKRRADEEVALIRRGGEERARGLRVQGGFERTAGEQARTASLFNASGSLLRGVGMAGTLRRDRVTGRAGD
ncbi:hypothetical protein CMI37_31330 [Candidatus Pacearchaeota archaeon]|nr:hypothetical protein [Candidatus Pacearchaeota archaeon]|tara:strand:+ start:2524 stop:2994 length:471 start_codon:yes stop_codon:yes gene_type:complete